MQKSDIAIFKTSKGLLLHGRVTSVTSKLITLKALGLKSVHRMNHANVARSVIEKPLNEMIAWNLEQVANPGKVAEERRRRQERKRRNALEYDLNGPPSRYDYMAGTI